MLLPKIPAVQASDNAERHGWQYEKKACSHRRARQPGSSRACRARATQRQRRTTEQLFGHMNGEFIRGQEFEGFEGFREKLEECIIHWNTVRRQAKLKGLTPEAISRRRISPHARLPTAFINPVQELRCGSSLEKRRFRKTPAAMYPNRGKMSSRAFPRVTALRQALLSPSRTLRRCIYPCRNTYNRPGVPRRPRSLLARQALCTARTALRSSRC